MIDVIIPAAGTSSRFSDEQNKLLVEIGGETVLHRTVKLFARLAEVKRIIVTARVEDVPRYREILSDVTRVHVVEGGRTRAESVKRALELTSEELVMIHDGARPFLSQELIQRLIERASEVKNVIPVLPCTDTMKKIQGDRIDMTLDRNELVAVQTPQVFDRAELVDAYASVEFNLATDDAQVMEMAGKTVYTLIGESGNRKITFSGDERAPSIGSTYSGIGYDVHRFAEGRKLMLGCTEIPHDKGLLGHSDADVVAHAICDALLSGSGNRDIGYHFPDTSKETEGMSGSRILSETAKIMRSSGYEIVNVAVVAVAQRPKLAPYISTMEENIASALGVDRAKISVSATTTERLGFEGREEGMSAQAICSLRKMC